MFYLQISKQPVLEQNISNYDATEKYLQINLRLNEDLRIKLNTAKSSFEMAMVYNGLNNN